MAYFSFLFLFSRITILYMPVFPCVDFRSLLCWMDCAGCVGELWFHTFVHNSQIIFDAPYCIMLAWKCRCRRVSRITSSIILSYNSRREQITPREMGATTTPGKIPPSWESYMEVTIAVTTIMTINTKICIFETLPLSGRKRSRNRTFHFDRGVGLTRCTTQ